jgi:hypothetical protein
MLQHLLEVSSSVWMMPDVEYHIDACPRRVPIRSRSAGSAMGRSIAAISAARRAALPAPRSPVDDFDGPPSRGAINGQPSA